MTDTFLEVASPLLSALCFDFIYFQGGILGVCGKQAVRFSPKHSNMVKKMKGGNEEAGEEKSGGC